MNSYDGEDSPEWVGRNNKADESGNRIYCVTHSDYQPTDIEQPLSLTLTSIVSDQAIANERVSVIQCFAVSFYTQMGNNFYPLKNTSAMKVVRVF